MYSEPLSSTRLLTFYNCLISTDLDNKKFCMNAYSIRSFSCQIRPKIGFLLEVAVFCEIIFTWYPIYQPLRSGRIWHKVNFFKQSLTGLNSEFSFSWTSCLTKAEEPSLPYYLPIAGGRIIGFIPFPRVLVLCEVQSVSSRIWTHVAVSISYDDNHYTTGTSYSYLI